MKKNLSIQEAYLSAAAYCSASEKSLFDVREKLLAWGVSDDDAPAILERLQAEKFIDQERFARAFVRDKFRFSHWGKIKIAFNLRQKEIPTPLIQEALEEISDEDYNELLINLLQTKSRSVKAKTDYEKRGKLFRFAQSRGFEPGVILKILERF